MIGMLSGAHLPQAGMKITFRLFDPFSRERLHRGLRHWRTMLGSMEPNSQLFEAYLKCSTKCWLRSRGQTGESNAYAEWVKEQNESYRAAGMQRLQNTVPESERVVAPPRQNLKAAKWRPVADVPDRAW